MADFEVKFAAAMLIFYLEEWTDGGRPLGEMQGGRASIGIAVETGRMATRRMIIDQLVPIRNSLLKPRVRA